MEETAIAKPRMKTRLGAPPDGRVEKPLKHSRLGIVSLVVGLVVLSTPLWIGVFNQVEAIQPIGAILFVGIPVWNLVGFALAIGGLQTPNRRRLSPILGLCVHLVILVFVVWVLIIFSKLGPGDFIIQVGKAGHERIDNERTQFAQEEKNEKGDSADHCSHHSRDGFGLLVTAQLSGREQDQPHSLRSHAGTGKQQHGSPIVLQGH